MPIVLMRMCTPLGDGTEEVNEYEVNVPEDVHQIILKGIKELKFGPEDESSPTYVLRKIDLTGEYPVIEVVPRIH